MNIDLRNFIKLFLVVFALSSYSCNENATSSTQLKNVFEFINEETDDYIAVYGSKQVEKAAYNRAYADVKSVIDYMDDGIKQGLLNANAKMLVVENEDELEDDIEFFMTLLPVEAVFTNDDGEDETTTNATDVGLSSTKLELMYLCVYYSLLTESGLANEFNELKAAYNQAIAVNIFVPGEAYQDGYKDETHQNASDENALKYGTYLFNLYKLYYGNGQGEAGEFTITTKAQLQSQNPLGYTFMSDYFEQKNRNNN